MAIFRRNRQNQDRRQPRGRGGLLRGRSSSSRSRLQPSRPVADRMPSVNRNVSAPQVPAAIPEPASPSDAQPVTPANTYQGESYLGGRARLRTDPQTGFDRMSYADGVDVTPSRQAFQRGMNLTMDQGPNRDPRQAQQDFQAAYRLAKSQGMTGPEMDKIQEKAQLSLQNNMSLEAGTMTPYYKADRDSQTGDYIGPEGKYRVPERSKAVARYADSIARPSSQSQSSRQSTSSSGVARPSPRSALGVVQPASQQKSQDAGGYQTYTSDDGRFSRDAVVMGIRNGNAIMQYTNGKTSDVPLNRLSPRSREDAIAAASVRDFVRGTDGDGMPVSRPETMARMFGGRDRSELYSSTTGRLTAGDPDAYTRQQAFNSAFGMAPPENPQINEGLVRSSRQSARDRMARAMQPGGLVSTDALDRMYEREEYERNAPLRSLAQRPDVTSDMNLGYTRSVNRDPSSENFGRAVVNEGLDVGQLRLGKGLAETDYDRLEARNRQRDEMRESARDLRTRTAQVQGMYPGTSRAGAAGIAQTEMDSQRMLQQQMKRQQEAEAAELKIKQDQAAAQLAREERAGTLEQQEANMMQREYKLSLGR